MLKLKCTGTEQLNPLTKFKLFEHENTLPSSGLVPNTGNRATEHPHKRPNENENEDNSGDCTSNPIDSLPSLLANEALNQAVTEVHLQMDGWPAPHIFGLFVVLVEPPTDLGLNDIEGLQDYLNELLVKVGCLADNGICGTTTHCWHTLLGKRSHITLHRSNFYIFTALISSCDKPGKQVDWVPILKLLKKSKKRLINWDPSVPFPSKGVFPRLCQTYRSMVKMFFNPDLASRLHLVPIEGKSQDLFNSCYSIDKNPSRSMY